MSVGGEFFKPTLKIACQTSSVTYLNEVASSDKRMFTAFVLFYVLGFYVISGQYKI